ncbi:MAG TPA: hypothetical protein VMT54_01855, partial [Candidatus Cybelea sp.]|nr:hypothetical protein [Candidatus Cybelea sp.]
ENMFELAKFSRAAGPRLSERFLLTTALSLTQEMGGSMAGTGIDQFVKQLVGGFQGQQHAAAKEFVRLGLAQPSDFMTTKTGEIKGMMPGRKLPSAALAASDPDLWVSTVLLPAMDKAGIKSIDDQIAEVRRLFPAGRAADLVAKLITQAPSFQQHAQLYAGAAGLTANQMNAKDPFVALNSLSTALQNFGAVLTAPAMPKAAEVLSKITENIGQLYDQYAKFAAGHETAAGMIGAGAAAAGGVGGFYLLYNGLMGGFGLGKSAVALDAAAAELTAAAVALKGGAAASAAGGVGGIPGFGKKPGIATTMSLWNLLTGPTLKTNEKGEITPPNLGWWSEPLSWSGQGQKLLNAWMPTKGGSEPLQLPGAVPPSPVGYGAMPTGAQDPAQMKEQIAMMEQAKEKADELHISVSQPAHPEIDLSAFNAAIDAAQAKWNAFKASISSLGTSLGASLPNLGPVQRGNFSHGGIGHE